jgi:hypothetical protein
MHCYLVASAAAVRCVTAHCLVLCLKKRYRSRFAGGTIDFSLCTMSAASMNRNGVPPIGRVYIGKILRLAAYEWVPLHEAHQSATLPKARLSLTLLRRGMLYAGNMNATSSPADLETLFIKHGLIKTIWVSTNQTEFNRPLGLQRALLEP